MLLTSAFRAALVAAAFALPALASVLPLPTEEIQVFGGTAPRMAATRLFFTPDFKMKGMVCVQYGQPAWKAEYDGMLPSLKGKSARLGKDFWTTFNTSVAFDIGGVAVPAGSYYLGLKCDANGEFSLAIMRAEAADKAGMGPFMPDAWKIDFAAPMKMAAIEKSADLLTIDLNADDKDKTLLHFVLSWGKHSLSVPMKPTFAPGT